MILFGLLRLGKLVRLVPYPVMLGFVNGTAIVIATAQLEHFKQGEHWLSGAPLYLMVGLVALTMLVVYVLPKLTRAVPPALVAILSVGVLVYLLGLPTRTWAIWRTSPVACRTWRCRTYRGILKP